MRALTKALVGVTTAVGLATGSLATAGTALAAPAQQTRAEAVSLTQAPLAVNNLGLSTTQARWVQCWIKDYYGYKGDLDGKLGTKSWMALQRWLKKHWQYKDDIDGIVGPNTIRALQRDLKKYHGYRGKIDGIAGAKTKAAFKDFAADAKQHC